MSERFIQTQAKVKASKDKVRKVFVEKERMLQLVDIVNRKEDEKIKEKLDKQMQWIGKFQEREEKYKEKKEMKKRKYEAKKEEIKSKKTKHVNTKKPSKK